MNGRVGQQSTGYEDIHGGYGYGEQNKYGVRILFTNFCVSNKLSIINTFFQKINNNRLVTYSYGGN